MIYQIHIHFLLFASSLLLAQAFLIMPNNQNDNSLPSSSLPPSLGRLLSMFFPQQDEQQTVRIRLVVPVTEPEPEPVAQQQQLDDNSLTFAINTTDNFVRQFDGPDGGRSVEKVSQHRKTVVTMPKSPQQLALEQRLKGQQQAQHDAEQKQPEAMLPMLFNAQINNMLSEQLNQKQMPSLALVSNGKSDSDGKDENDSKREKEKTEVESDDKSSTEEDNNSDPQPVVIIVTSDVVKNELLKDDAEQAKEAESDHDHDKQSDNESVAQALSDLTKLNADSDHN